MSKFLQAGKAMLQGDFQAAVKSVTETPSYPISPATYRGIGEGWSFSTGNHITSYFRYSDQGDCIKAYTECAPVNAVINKKAQAFINGQTWVLNSRGKEATSAEAKKMKERLAHPNIIQSWDQFEAQMYIYVALFGYCPVWVMIPTGYTDPIDATAMWCIPPNCIDIRETNKVYRQRELNGIIQNVMVTFGTERLEIPINQLMLIRDNTISLDSYVLPDSRIRALQMPINNTMGAYESRNVLINYRGALGIFSKDPGGGAAGLPSTPVTKTEKEELQKDFQQYGLRRSQWQFIITTAALKWQSVSVPTKDLMLFEEVDSGTMAICDGYNFPYELMSSGKGVTFANKNEAKKLLYQDAIIPEAKSIYSQINTFFRLSEYNLLLDKDYSKIPVLQADKVQEMQARYTRDQAYQIEWDNDLITRNEWRVANGEDPLEGESGKLRKSELLALTGEPLINALGVGGTQALIAVLTANIPAEAAQEVLTVVFNIPPASAAKMVEGKTVQTQSNDTATTETEEQPTEAAA